MLSPKGSSKLPVLSKGKLLRPIPQQAAVGASMTASAPLPLASSALDCGLAPPEEHSASHAPGRTGHSPGSCLWHGRTGIPSKAEPPDTAALDLAGLPSPVPVPVWPCTPPLRETRTSCLLEGIALLIARSTRRYGGCFFGHKSPKRVSGICSQQSPRSWDSLGRGRSGLRPRGLTAGPNTCLRRQPLVSQALWPSPHSALWDPSGGWTALALLDAAPRPDCQPPPSPVHCTGEEPSLLVGLDVPSKAPSECSTDPHCTRTRHREEWKHTHSHRHHPTCTEPLHTWRPGCTNTPTSTQTPRPLSHAQAWGCSPERAPTTLPSRLETGRCPAMPSSQTGRCQGESTRGEKPVKSNHNTTLSSPTEEPASYPPHGCCLMDTWALTVLHNTSLWEITPAALFHSSQPQLLPCPSLSFPSYCLTD